MRLGEGFYVPEPEAPSKPSRTDLLLEAVLAELRSRPAEPLVVPAPEVRVETPTLDLSELFELVASQKPGATADEIGAAVARYLAPPEAGDNSAVFAELITAIKALDSRVTGIGMQSFGSSGPANIADSPTRELGRVTVKANETDYARQTTLASVLAAVDGLEAKDYATQTTLAAVLTALTRTHKIAEGSAVVTGAGGFQTIVTVTPTVPTIVTGFNSDVSAILDIAYRYQLVIGGVVKVSETITANRNSWVPARLSVAAGTEIAVQVDHAEVADQSFRASIAYDE